MASRTFTTRFTMTCSSWPGSALLRPSAGGRTVRSATSSPIRRRSMDSMFSTTALRSRTLGWRTCLRLKARSWRVSWVARMAVFRKELDVATHRVLGTEPLEQEVAPAEHDGHEVVEVVRDAAGEAPHRLHLL